MQRAGPTPATIAAALVAGLAGGAIAGAVVALQLARIGTASVEQTPPPPPQTPATTLHQLEVRGGDSEAIRNAIAKVDRAVVLVTSVETGLTLFGELREQEAGQGTGFVFDAERGYILTNQHVVQGSDRPIVKMKQPDGSAVQLRGFVIGQSGYDDLAIIKVDAQNLPAVELGDSESLQVGDLVVAIGSPYGYEHTATLGIVSALKRVIVVREAPNVARRYDDMIQTDAAINRGNSGGPLVNLAGHVVGMNTIIRSESGGSEGIGFAISSAKLSRSVESLLSENFIGAVLGTAWRGWTEAVGAPKGAWCQVYRVMPGSPAEQAGLKEDDLILSFGGREILTPADIGESIRAATPSKPVEVRVFRYDQATGKASQLRLNLTVRRRGDQ